MSTSRIPDGRSRLLQKYQRTKTSVGVAPDAQFSYYRVIVVFRKPLFDGYKNNVHDKVVGSVSDLKI